MNLKQIMESFDEKYTNKVDKYNPLRKELLELYKEQKQFISTSITQLLEELRMKHQYNKARGKDDYDEGYNDCITEINSKINKILNK